MQRNGLRRSTTVIGVERIEPVRIDHPKLSDGGAPTEVSVWRTAVGFECFASFAEHIYHGVSPDGRWLVMDYYPTITSGTSPRVALWDRQFYVFYHEEDVPIQRSLRVAHGMDRHSLASEDLNVLGVARDAAITGFSVVRFDNRWILFFELTQAATTGIAYADAQELRGPWIMRGILDLTEARPSENCTAVSPAALVVAGRVLLFYSVRTSRDSQIACARLGGEPLSVESKSFVAGSARFGKRAQVTCALQWGPRILAYIGATSETWRLDCSVRTPA